MARPPITEAELVARYGPHLNEAPPGGWNADLEIDREVKTHCCFCGQQCGIILKVHANEVVGFEPWYEFPFNEGKLCPKGVKRYLQGSHPDRLTRAARPNRRTGFDRSRGTRHSIGPRRRSGASRTEYGPDSVAIYGGASLTTEKAYLVGKFARLAVGTANVDYNGRLCMVSAGAAYKTRVRHRPRAEPLGRHPARRRRVRRRRQHRRVRTDHHQLRVALARPRRQAHRRRPARHAPRPHRGRLPRAPSRHGLGLDGHDPAPADRARLARPRLHRGAHRRLRGGGRGRARLHAGLGRRRHRRARGPHRGGRRALGHRGDGDAPARPRHRAPEQGSRERALVHQPRARRPAASAGPGKASA